MDNQDRTQSCPQNQCGVRRCPLVDVQQGATVINEEMLANWENWRNGLSLNNVECSSQDSIVKVAYFGAKINPPGNGEFIQLSALSL
jgi:hypothetical protein